MPEIYRNNITINHFNEIPYDYLHSYVNKNGFSMPRFSNNQNENNCDPTRVITYLPKLKYFVKYEYSSSINKIVNISNQRKHQNVIKRSGGRR